jgi:hypothetical protein
MRGSVPSHNGCSILLYGGGRITQLQYLLLKYSQFLGANFREIVEGEVRRIPFPRTPVNKGKILRAEAHMSTRPLKTTLLRDVYAHEVH